MSATVALEGLPETASTEETAAKADAMVGQAEVEQKEAKGTKEEGREAGIELEKTEGVEDKHGEDDRHVATRPDISQSKKAEAVERIRQGNLPPVLKERLTALVEVSGAATEGSKTSVPVEEAIRAMEEALPDFLRSSAPGARQLEHPGGDAFFSGDASELSDAQAEELARQQLARSGLLRGQRVRVAEE